MGMPVEDVKRHLKTDLSGPAMEKIANLPEGSDKDAVEAGAKLILASKVGADDLSEVLASMGYRLQADVASAEGQPAAEQEQPPQIEGLPDGLTDEQKAEVAAILDERIQKERETLEPKINDALKEKAEAEARLAKLEDAKKLEEFNAIAAKFDRLPDQDKKLGAALKAASEKVPDLYSTVLQVLTAANAMLSASGTDLQEPIGETPSHTESTGAEAQVEMLVKEKMKAIPSLTKQQATAQVYKEIPEELYEALGKED